MEAVRYNTDPDVKARMDVIDEAVKTEHLVELLERRALVKQGMDTTKILVLKQQMERAMARRIQPHYVHDFFLEAFKRLGGKAFPREEGRYEITHIPPLLGANGKRTWLVLLQNPAEARATGGLIGGYALVTADRGHLALTSSGSNDDLLKNGPITTSVVSQGLRDLWGADLADWRSINLSPHFPDTGILAHEGMKERGTPVDGVVAVDPTIVSALLAGTGPLNPSSRFAIKTIEASPGGFTLTWTAVPGRTYIVQAREDLSSGRWLDIATDLTNDTEVPKTLSYIDSVTSSSRRFYRLVVQ
jgi:hypothetical protein